MDEQNTNMLMDWDDSIEKDSSDFLILPEGDYNFEVTGFERGRFPGSAKIPPCNKASLQLRVDTKEGTAFVFTDLILYRSLEWKLSEFFRCIGKKKSGEKLTMDWNHIIGSRGRAHFKPRTYTDKDGNERQANNVEKYLDYDEKNFPADDGFMNIPDGVADELPFN